jgi:Ca2+-binding RTX toxin-like protein
MFQVTNQPVNGSANADTIAAYNLGEKISGLAGDDTIDAKGGNDTVDGNEGKDTLTGGPGGDTFVFSAKLKKANVDHITDFTPGTDTVQIDASVFKKLGPGDLSRKAFFAKKNADSAKDKKDRIIYDTKSSELYFDKDGKGGKGGKLFAILDGKPDIDHGDIVIIA